MRGWYAAVAAAVGLVGAAALALVGMGGKGPTASAAGKAPARIESPSAAGGAVPICGPGGPTLDQPCLRPEGVIAYRDAVGDEVDHFPQPWREYRDANYRLSLPAGWTVAASGSGGLVLSFAEASGATTGGIEVVGWSTDGGLDNAYRAALPNHCDVQGQADVTSSAGAGRAFVLQCQPPAASGESAVWWEQHAILPTGGHQAVDVWLRVPAEDSLPGPSLDRLLRSLQVAGRPAA